MDVPSGVIAIWSGAIVNIPIGWVICDGTNGTPDLRNKFVVGAGSTYAVGATGGSTTHTHTFITDGHDHDIVAGLDFGAGVMFDDLTSAETDSGTTNAGSSLPPYYALAYIMKS
jgi:microcystin-dependent protein